MFDLYGAPVGSNLDAGTFLGTIPDAEPYRSLEHGIVGDRIYVRTFEQVYSAPLTGGGLTLLHGPLPGSPAMLAAAGGHVFETTLPDTFYDFKSDGTVLQTVPGMPGDMDVTATADGRYAFFVARNAADAGFDAATDAYAEAVSGDINYALHSTSECGGAGELEYTGTNHYVPYPGAVDGAFTYFSTGSADILRIAK